MSKIILSSLFIVFTLLSSCSIIDPYEPKVRQGNILDRYSVGKLMLGMSKDEVQKLLGKPVLSNIFYKNIWEYINQSDDKNYRLQLVFSNKNKLIKINTVDLMALPKMNKKQLEEIQKNKRLILEKN